MTVEGGPSGRGRVPHSSTAEGHPAAEEGTQGTYSAVGTLGEGPARRNGVIVANQCFNNIKLLGYRVLVLHTEYLAPQARARARAKARSSTFVK
jgi:hypothetical protein